jgi:hypothetical protein
LRPAKDACPPAAARLAVGRHFERALLKSIGAALLISMVPLQLYAQNAASPVPNELTEAEPGDRAPIVIIPNLRVLVAVPSQKGRPTVIPQRAVPAEPAALVPNETDAKVQPSLRSDTAVVAPAAVPQPPAFHPDTDADQSVISSVREPNGFTALYRASHFGGRYPRYQQGPIGAPPSGPLAGACGLKGAAQRANAVQQCLSALAYVLSPPPATRGVLPRYLPTISPQDAQPIPSVAATTPPPRSAWRQAGRVRRSQGHQCRHRQGAQRLLAELPHPFHAQRAGSCRQERSARRLRFHRHRLCPRRCGGHPGAIAPRRRPQDRKLL